MLFGTFLSGVFMMGLAIVGLIFLRSWKETHDRLFLSFGVAFFLLAIERIPLALFHRMKEPGSLVYLLRLAAFLLILQAILAKNYGRSKPNSRSPHSSKPRSIE